MVEMITTTHIVTNALIAQNRKGGIVDALAGSPAKWFVAGGLAPDLGLYVLSAGAAIYFPLTTDMTVGESLQHAFENLFFSDPYWIAIHNSLHSPVVLAGIAGVAGIMKKPGAVAFAAGCLLHTLMDIPVHHDDGPLLFFPFDWSTRYESPVSYWDPEHFGRFVQPIDFAITILGGAAVAGSWWKNRRAGKR